MHGGDALKARLDQLAARGRPARGWHSQLLYLTRSARLRTISTNTFGVRNLIAWLRGPDTPGGRAPAKSTQREIAKLYDQQHKQALAARLKTQLNDSGRGTTVEVHPTEDVVSQSRGGLGIQYVVITDWDAIIDAWAEDDDDAIYEEWEDIADDELYASSAYYNVSHLGF